MNLSKESSGKSLTRQANRGQRGWGGSKSNQRLLGRQLTTLSIGKNADVVIVVPSLVFGGTQRVATMLANAWFRSARHVCVVVMNDTRRDDFVLEKGVDRIPLGIRFPRKGSWTRLPGLTKIVAATVFFRGVFQLRRIFSQKGACIVVSFIAATNVTCILACLRSKRRLVVCERNDPSRQRNGWFWDWTRVLLYRYADVVTANSHGALQSMNRYVPRGKLAYVPNPVCGIDSSVFGLRPRQPIVLSVGRLVKQKGYDVLIRGFAKVAKELPTWRLAIVGDGPLRDELKQIASQLGVDDRIDWHGFVLDPYPHYQSAAIFTLASRYEGMPNALLEAMQCGMAVVVNDASPGPLEVVEHDISGLVVEREDDAALATAIIDLGRDSERRSRLGAAARERMSEFSLDRVLLTWEEVIGLRKSQQDGGETSFSDA